MDIAASLINLFAVRYSLTPPDDEHRFGHGKAEPLAGLAQATFIAGSAIFLILHAIDRLRHPQPLEDVSVGVIVMVVSIIATLVLLKFQRYVINKTASTAIRADALHYATDLLTNLSIIAALLLSAYWNRADAWFAIAIAIYILYSAWKIGSEAFHILMDRELPEDIQKRILELVKTHPGVYGTHDLRTRQSGQTKFIQIHIEMDARLSFIEAHDIADNLERLIKKTVPDSEVIIHQDPINVKS
jgi:ferrous-iron efflux pump FieF